MEQMQKLHEEVVFPLSLGKDPYTILTKNVGH